MRWIDHRSFFGLDRRKLRAVLRLIERRRASHCTEPPSLAAALRQLRVRALATDSPEGVAEFLRRAQAVAELAQAYGETAIGAKLVRIAEQVASRPQSDWRAWLDDRIGKLSDHTLPGDV